MSRRVVLTCCALLPLLAPCISAQTHGHSKPAAISPADEATFERAMHLLDSGHADQAQPLLEDLNHRHRDNYEISESLGLLYAAANRLDDALPLLQAGARDAPDAAVAHANLGTAYLKLGRTNDAVTELSRAHTLDVADPQTADALGQALLQAKQPCKAAEAFHAVQPPAVDPDLPYNTALALFDCGQYEEAAVAAAAIPDAAQSAGAQSLLGDIDEHRKRYKDAADHYIQAAQLDPTEQNIYALGLDLLRHWSFEPAVRAFATGADRFPGSRRMTAGLGIAYYGDAKYKEAIGVFDKLLQAEPTNSLYAEIYGRACTVLTDTPDPLCAHLLPLAQSHPGNAPLGLYAAIAIIHKPADPQQLLLAQNLLEGVLKTSPHLATAHYELGILLQQQNHWPESIPELQQALAQDPTMARAHYRLGLAYRRTGRNDDAQREMSIDRQEDQEQRNDLNARMQQITTLLVKMQ